MLQTTRFINTLLLYRRYILQAYAMKQYVITKKIAKHGKQAIIVIPKLLEAELKPSTVVKLTIDVVKEAE